MKTTPTTARCIVEVRDWYGDKALIARRLRATQEEASKALDDLVAAFLSANPGAQISTMVNWLS